MRGTRAPMHAARAEMCLSTILVFVLVCRSGAPVCGGSRRPRGGAEVLPVGGGVREIAPVFVDVLAICVCRTGVVVGCVGALFHFPC